MSTTKRKQMEPGNLIGGFEQDPNKDFKASIENMFETMKESYHVDAWSDIVAIAKSEEMASDYKELLYSDVMESANNDEYMSNHFEMLSQMHDNSMVELVNESQTATNMNPVTGVTPPVLKKNYFAAIAKDIMASAVADKPLIRLEFERQYLLGEDMETRYYVPDIYSNGKWKELYKDMRGVNITDKVKVYNNGAAQAGHSVKAGSDALQLPMMNFDLFAITGASVKKDDNIGLDCAVVGIEATVPVSPQVDGQDTQAIVKVVPEIIPDFAHRGTGNFDVVLVDANGKKHLDKVYFTVDRAAGKVTASSAAGLVTGLKFGGHIANKNNLRGATMRKEVTEREYSIADGERVNCNLTVEDIKDQQALNHIDLTTELIVDISTTLTQFEDMRCIEFLEEEYGKWKDAPAEDLPFGYGEHMLKGTFTEEAKFSVVPPVGPTVVQSQYIASELKFNIERIIDELIGKFDKKDDSDIAFSIYAHPKNIRLLSPEINWSESTSVGGMKAEYKYGVMLTNGTKVRVVSSKKIDPAMGYGIVSIPQVKDVVTFKNLKYALNIETTYRNPQTDLTPNVMGTQRYKNISVLAIQGRMKLVNNTFGNVNPMNVVKEEPGYLV